MLEKFEVVVRKPVSPYEDEVHPLSDFKFNFDKLYDTLEYFDKSLQKGDEYIIHEEDLMEGYKNLPNEYLKFRIKYKKEYIIKDCGKCCAKCDYRYLCVDGD